MGVCVWRSCVRKFYHSILILIPPHPPPHTRAPTYSHQMFSGVRGVSAVVMDGKGHAEVVSSRFQFNHAPRGIIHLTGMGSGDLRNCTLERNTVVDGTVYVAQGSRLNVSVATTFVGNRAYGSGGGIYLEKGALLQGGEDVVFRRNRAKKGGALWVGGSDPPTQAVTLKKTVFDHNSAVQGSDVFWVPSHSHQGEFECIACEYLGQGSLPSGGSGGGGIRIATTTTNYSAISTAVQQFSPYTPHTISFQLLDMYVRRAC